MKQAFDDNLRKLADADLRLKRVSEDVQKCQLRLQELQREQQLALGEKRDAQAVIEALRPLMEAD